MRLLSLLVVLIASASGLLPAQAGEAVRYRATAWVSGAASSVRLILPETMAPGQEVMAGLDMRLAPGAKTYWRSPGETGVAPTIDFSGSSGLTEGTMLFPAPIAFDDGAGGVAVGYTQSLLFPLRLTGSAAPHRLIIAFDYGVCHRNMCMPAHATISASPGEGEPEDGLAAHLAGWLAKVPAKTPHPVLSILSSTHRREGGDIILALAARAPAGSRPSLFAEGQELSFTTKLVAIEADGTARFEAGSPLPPGGATPPALTVTLVAGDAAIETIVPLR